MTPPEQDDGNASGVFSFSLPNDVADILASSEGAERRLDRVLALTRRVLAADRIALWETAPTLARQLTVDPWISQEERDVLARQLADALRLLVEVSNPPSKFILEGRLTVPVIGVGELLGLLRVERSAEGFDVRDLGQLSVIAAQIGTYLKVIRSEQALRDSEERLRRVYEAGMIGIAFLDESGAVKEANEPARRMLGTADPDEALRLAQARLSTIIAIAADAIITVDEEQRILLFNRGAEKIFGYSRDEVLGQRLDMLLPERYRDLHRKEVRGFLGGSSEARLMGESRPPIFGRRKSGEEFPAEAAISKLESGGRVLGTAILRDISERKRIENEQRFLAEAGAILSLSLDQDETLSRIAELAVRFLADCCIVDLVGGERQVRRVRVASADPAKQALADALEKVSIDLERPYFARSAIEARQSVLVQDVPAAYLEAFGQSEEHARILRELAPSAYIAVPLLVRGRCLGALVFISATPGRRYGPADLRLAEELAHRAALAVDNAVLYRSATEAIRARDDVLAVVAHDLRNPLNTIQLVVQLLDRELSGDSSSRARIEAIARASGRANRLIQDLVDQYRFDTGQLELDRAELDAAALVLDVVDSQQALGSAASLDLQADVRSERPLVFADRDRLLQVFENLIGNAFKFTPPGERVSVGVELQGDELLFWVTDSGQGIAPEHLLRVFDRFWREDEKDRRGAGLGLSICKQIIEAHGGRIWVESRRGAGTTFFFTIPTA